MNKDVQTLLNVYTKDLTQRDLAKLTGFSLGKVNKILIELKNNNYIVSNSTNEKLLDKYKVNSAIILAAGYGLRMIPINRECPKALLSVNDEILIERIIKQLHERNIFNIFVVVGFQKEKFEYLIDKYNVKLIVNSSYGVDNNLISVFKASKYLGSSYIIPGDLYLKNNVFNKYEEDSWYALSNIKRTNGYYYISKDKKLIKGHNYFYDSIGISFISKKDGVRLINNINRIIDTNTVSYWEDAIFLNNSEVKIDVRFFDNESYFEINTFNDLLELDKKSESLNSQSIQIIQNVFNVGIEDIKNVSVSKKGMTNKSFMFDIKGKKYIMRTPGEGTEKLINRQQEYQVYKLLSTFNITDKVVYMDPKTGVKITEFIYDSHNCDISNWDEITRCMDKLRSFHKMHLKVDFEFDLYKQINYYELLRGDESLYDDYESVKRNCMKLESFIDDNKLPFQLCHIDSVPDNFLINENGISLIDWEYASNQDPHLDIAMFVIYAGYSKEEADRLIDIYFDNNVEEKVRYKIYAYIALAGLLWSNWCEYKHTLGIEFGDYSLNQYRYGKDYSRLVLKYLGEKYE